MRSGIDDIILAPPDTSGFLGAAALRRRLPGSDVAFLWPHELSRRVAALADEPNCPVTWVADLVPTDSVRSLLIPSLQRLVDRDVRAVWYYGRAEPAPALQALGDVVELHYEEGAGTWRLARGQEDEGFLALADDIEGTSGGTGAGWRLMLRALTTSWDWARIYGSLESLVVLRPTTVSDLAWARGQLAEAERAESLVVRAEVRDVDGVLLAVVTDPMIPARVRPETFQGLRGDVDALAFLGGPGRLVIVLERAGEPPGFLRILAEDPGLTVGSLAGPRTDVVWRPGTVPESVAGLFGRRDFEAIEDEPPAGESARIAHAPDERIAKGLRPARLDAGDRRAVLDGLRERLREGGRHRPPS
ncbi:MAG: hypothetical protein ACRDJ5_06335 [Actinomycetota bacterium]